MSICLAALLGGSAFALNPQLFLENYLADPVQRFKATCLKEGETLYAERVDVIALFQREHYVPRLHLLENIYSKHDIFQHLMPFLEAFHLHGEELYPQADHCKILFYHSPAGHGGFPPTADCVRSIHEALEENSLHYQKCETSFLKRIAAGTDPRFRA